MPESVPPQWHLAAQSDPGRDPNKQVNEDAFRAVELPDGLLVVVCDGMGGHVGGRIASQAAVQTIEQEWRGRGPVTDPRRLLGECIARAGTEVYALGGTNAASERPGSTCVAAWLGRDGLFVAHVGDSRAYRLRAGQLYPLTRDHTVVEAWLQAGQITPEQAKGHPDAHRITRALGIAPHVEVELRPSEDVRPFDRLLLCTDGLTDLIEPSELVQRLGSPSDLDSIARGLVELANQRGGHDNITVVLIEIVSVSGAFAQTLSGTTEAVPATPEPIGFPKTLPIDATHLVVPSPVVAQTLERVPGLPTSPRTTANVATDKTIVMGIAPSTESAANTMIDAPLMERGERTIPLPQPLLHVPMASQPEAEALTRQRRAQRNVWFAIGISVLLGVLSVLVRLLRHR